MNPLELELLVILMPYKWVLHKNLTYCSTPLNFSSVTLLLKTKPHLVVQSGL